MDTAILECKAFQFEHRSLFHHKANKLMLASTLGYLNRTKTVALTYVNTFSSFQFFLNRVLQQFQLFEGFTAEHFLYVIRHSRVDPCSPFSDVICKQKENT